MRVFLSLITARVRGHADPTGLARPARRRQPGPDPRRRRGPRAGKGPGPNRRCHMRGPPPGGLAWGTSQCHRRVRAAPTQLAPSTGPVRAKRVALARKERSLSSRRDPRSLAGRPAQRRYPSTQRSTAWNAASARWQPKPPSQNWGMGYLRRPGLPVANRRPRCLHSQPASSLAGSCGPGVARSKPTRGCANERRTAPRPATQAPYRPHWKAQQGGHKSCTAGRARPPRNANRGRRYYPVCG